MGCNVIKDPNGKLTAIVCTRGPKARCKDCGASASILCDFPVTRNGKETTCDRGCCRNHAIRVGQDKDFCLPHHRYSQKGTNETK